ncbi:TlyA family RNA methyltransferase [Chrysiogenes arsenatis]|uniref:TlyA family RNA methyltransferase n=1 Tax=Chrysiogenes arsenatis TaxID=309797 RepID=UPI0004121717|nr:TlyA family RNA methyltransferase [Chrysiogenes arsenatis]
MKVPKIRLDKLLVDRDLAQSRERAKALIMAGEVIVNDHRVDKPGTDVPLDAVVRLKTPDIPFVSRGGLKLAHALQYFSVNPDGLRCLDIGSSTGGFTDCLLQNGAREVYAVDVGTNQLDWRLRQHPQVVVHEQTDIRRYVPANGLTFALIVTDVSFISLTKILPEVIRLGTPDAFAFIGLIKPQFELEKVKIGKGGIVRDEVFRQEAIDRVCHELEKHCLALVGITPSPITGTDGNQEYLIYCRPVLPNP